MATDEEIKNLAYKIWEQEGRPEGKDKEHWFLAEKLLVLHQMLQMLLDKSRAELPKAIIRPSDRTGTNRMMRLFIAGLQAMVLGLSIMVIDYSLKITPANTQDVVDKLVQSGLVVTVVGFIIIIIGLFRGFWGNLTQETIAIFSAGSSIVVKGISVLLRVLGRENERALYDGAWAT